MADQEEKNGKCDQCGKSLPLIGDSGIHNFHVIGGIGWGKQKHVCTDCKRILEQPKSLTTGWGS